MTLITELISSQDENYERIQHERFPACLSFYQEKRILAKESCLGWRGNTNYLENFFLYALKAQDTVHQVHG